jgi:hypothetical protein
VTQNPSPCGLAMQSLLSSTTRLVVPRAQPSRTVRLTRTRLPPPFIREDVLALGPKKPRGKRVGVF